MTHIEIYTKNLCVFCDRAKNFFQSRNLNFNEYNVFLNPAYLDLMLKRSNGQRTMPQIFINNQHIGGFDDLKKIINNGEFETMINS